jgi:hypothetical protein
MSRITNSSHPCRIFNCRFVVDGTLPITGLPLTKANFHPARKPCNSVAIGLASLSMGSASLSTGFASLSMGFTPDNIAFASVSTAFTPDNIAFARLSIGFAQLSMGANLP